MNQSLYLVAGLGKTGNSIARYLQRRDIPFIVFDTRETVQGLEEFKETFPGVDVFLHTLPDTIYTQLTAVIASPGISLDEPFLQKAKQANIPVFGDIECLAREIKAPVIAITGTNGKSTVTTLVGEMAKEAGLNVAIAGNIGTPVLDFLDDDNSYSLWVLELSSFQLDLTYSLKPIAATLLNISPDHLDRHHTLAEYIKSKQKIYHNAGFLLYNRDDRCTVPVKESASVKEHFGLNHPDKQNWGVIEKDGEMYLAHGDELLLSTNELRLKGKQNWQNALAACALAEAAGIARQSMLAVLKSFAGLPHRCQWVRNLAGVDYINDSKGTNIGAAISAISGIGGSINGKIVLIAGGIGKGADFSELKSAVRDYVRSVILIGEDASKIEQALQGTVPIMKASSLDEAVLKAKEAAISKDAVLLSPACASFDMFRDFNHRGESFTQLVEQL